MANAQNAGMPSSAPRLLAGVPVLKRSATELQVGVHEGLILPAAPEVQAALDRLDGTMSLGQVAVESGISRATLRTLIDQLRAADLLASGPAPSVRPVVRLLGAGLLGREFAHAYATSPPGNLQLVDPGLPNPELYSHMLPTAAESLRAQLRALGHERVTTIPHWYQADGPAPDLTVVAFDRLECDRAITDTLLREDQPHLFLRPLPGGVIVGPLVVPGTTCCTRCMDLVRAQDRAWPLLLAQLCLAESLPPSELLSWAVSTALLQVRSWLAGGTPETLSATLEIQTKDWAIAQRHWPVHPDCGCRELL